MQSEKILELKELHISFTQYTRGLQRRTIENVCGLSFSTSPAPAVPEKACWHMP